MDRRGDDSREGLGRDARVEWAGLGSPSLVSDDICPQKCRGSESGFHVGKGGRTIWLGGKTGVLGPVHYVLE